MLPAQAIQCRLAHLQPKSTVSSTFTLVFVLFIPQLTSCCLGGWGI